MIRRCVAAWRWRWSRARTSRLWCGSTLGGLPASCWCGATRERGVEAVDNPHAEAPQGAGPATASFLLRKGVTAVVAGQFGPKAEDALRAGGILPVAVAPGTKVERGPRRTPGGDASGGGLSAMRVAVASGKGGTGKTLVATHLARSLAARTSGVAYVDTDVEAPNGHLFFQPDFTWIERHAVLVPTLDGGALLGLRRVRGGLPVRGDRPPRPRGSRSTPSSATRAGSACEPAPRRPFGRKCGRRGPCVGATCTTWASSTGRWTRERCGPPP